MRQHPELAVQERRRFGKSEYTRVEALRRFRAGDSLASIARWLGLSVIQTRYLVIQERVEDGEVSRVAPDAEAIRSALDQGGEFGTNAWVACRAFVVENQVRRVGRT